ncbi:acetyl/propionyl/methylcrotonyl-CoA carboxylase subunit alpha [Saccharothrix yanglingensis]|uniref:Acetyl/propionyl-CoA carboxylase subunit alpha n=1 Tax=Saccharothrix yanglingensis TaxID=659496 RepID=A0ABU0WWS1_9PSEU|nr:biotin carboxylase N-terminal domain-containing protein [Saccharothrix yanglingensis]MDQ2584302.1 acetyl/propionyl-CoA carboxylase subunit alpha [Saccharothrix yanglingensis]
MIRRLLIANRGEIARRVIRTCRELGVSPVAVFSDPDARAPHVREADASVRLPGASPTETYLRADLLVAAALASGADAVHPGYGFLSENASFARAVLDAGLTWVGPDPGVIEAMGSKVAAKERMAAVGVPVLPELDPETATGFPLLVKASAGGGGRGMRVVRSHDRLAGAVAAARREAESAFGDGTVFCEPLLEHARHVEVQVLADAHGTVWALGERECSIQRRHQKIVEETPSPAVTAEARERLFAAATRAAEAIGYVGAGTVEFLYTDDGDFHFLEVNTRLQVEHPVTEEVFGVDLVAWQLAIAEGARLPAEPPSPDGHAVEVRLYAEDPAHDWRPASGVLHRFAVPGGVRVDSGVEDGSEVGVHYDPMLAKVVAWAPTRHAAVRKLAAALERAELHGLVTNRDLLVRVLRHPEFEAGATHTGFLDQHRLTEPPGTDVRPAALAAALALAERRRDALPLTGAPLGWRNLASQPQRAVFEHGDEVVEVDYRHTRAGVETGVEGLTVVSAARDAVVIERGGVRTAYPVAVYDDRVEVGPVSLRTRPRFPEPEAVVAEGATVAPMPGTVVRVAVEAGQRVEAGAELFVLEAMKMEHRVLAASGGTVTEVLTEAGRQVDAGDVLAVVVEDPLAGSSGGSGR